MTRSVLNSVEASRIAYKAALTGSFWEMISLMDLTQHEIEKSEIDSASGWRNLAMLSQFCFTLGNQVMLRSVSEAAYRNAANAASDDDRRMMMISQANGGRIKHREVLPLLDDPSHNSHYLASRLGALAYVERDTLVIHACIDRLARQDQANAALVDPQMELEILLACSSIANGQGYHRQRLLHALRLVKPQWRQRYAQHMGSLFGSS